MIYELPRSVAINGKDYDVNSDFRCILDIMEVLSDKELTDRERAFLALGFFYPELESIDPADYEEAVKQLYWFINAGQDLKANTGGKIMDWEQDFPYIIGPINKAAGHDVRSDPYMHWWTFLSYYMDIGDCLFSQILRIRQLRMERKTLDKTDAEWYRKNKNLVDLKSINTFTDSEMAFFESIKGGG